MSQLLTPTMIIEKTQLGKVVSLLKGLERCFNAENEKSIFLDRQIWFITISSVKVKDSERLSIFLSKKIDFSFSAL